LNANAHNLLMRRVSLWVATIVTVALLTRLLAQTLPDDTPILNGIMLALFVVLTTWLVLWFWIAAVGAYLTWEQGRIRHIRLPPLDPEDAAALSRTAILLPVYNEEPRPVFARIRAMLQSLRAAGHDSKFDFFVLSDTRDPDIWLEEEWHWLELQSELTRPGAVYYRRRSENTGRKAGNIADFCEHWGADYRYMVVLDADSLMDAETFVELVYRMDADPQLGLLQTPTLPLGDRSLLSRCQQFAAKLCTPMLCEALEWFSADGGNYWGHNAIIRTAVFTRFCGLSELPGKPPLGGPILSHDFVEAALMQRAGYKVRLATDLTASYEECPSTLPLFAQRDQRWCQGNLQHARLIISRRIPSSNRFHFATGVMAYISSPLWLSFLIVGLAARFASAIKSDTAVVEAVPDHSHWYAIGVFATVMSMLVAPRIWGAMLAARDRKTRAGFGGVLRLARSVMLEFVVSVLIAPIMMAFHTLFVVSTLAGHRVEWNAQSRSETGVGWRQAWYAHRSQMIAGVLATALAAAFVPDALPWLSPILFGLVFSIPISMLASHARFGEWLKGHGLLQIPEETDPPEILQLFEQTLNDNHRAECPPRSTVFHGLLDDPIWLRSHLSMLAATNTVKPAPPELVQECETLIRRGDWSELPKQLKQILLADPEALTELHHTTWSMRSLELMSHDRVSVQIQPDVVEALANEGV
jgi:membrane glycosyltransferase